MYLSVSVQKCMYECVQIVSICDDALYNIILLQAFSASDEKAENNRTVMTSTAEFHTQQNIGVSVSVRRKNKKRNLDTTTETGPSSKNSRRQLKR